MPLLNSHYLANWYKITIPYYELGNRYPTYDKVLIESFTQSKVQDASNKGMIQGDIGVRVMDIGTLYYTSTLSGPIIVPLANVRNEYTDLFNLISNNIAYQTYGNLGLDGATYLLKSAQIQVTTESVRATANFEGDYEINPTSYNGDTPQDVALYARTARFYDTKFYFGTLTNYYAVVSGDININFDLDKNFFLGQNWGTNISSQSPYFSIRGYNATGNVKIALTPEEYAVLAGIYGVNLGLYGSYQAPGVLGVNSGNIGVSIANNGGFKNLNLGSYFIINKIEFSMQQNSIISATLEFNAFFNSTFDLTTFETNQI
jgi:hypothetical protein